MDVAMDAMNQRQNSVLGPNEPFLAALAHVRLLFTGSFGGHRVQWLCCADVEKQKLSSIWIQHDTAKQQAASPKCTERAAVSPSDSRRGFKFLVLMVVQQCHNGRRSNILGVQWAQT